MPTPWNLIRKWKSVKVDVKQTGQDQGRQMGFSPAFLHLSYLFPLLPTSPSLLLYYPLEHLVHSGLTSRLHTLRCLGRLAYPFQKT